MAALMVEAYETEAQLFPSMQMHMKQNSVATQTIQTAPHSQISPKLN